MKRVNLTHWICLALLCVAALLLALHSQNPVQEGYGLIFSATDRFPGATALFSFRDEQGVLIWEAGVEAVRPLARGKIYVDHGNLTRTAFALANPYPLEVEVRLELRDEAGQSMGVVTRLLKARQHEAVFTDELFQLGSDFLGTLEFETTPAGQGIGVITLRLQQNYRGEPVFATFPVARRSPGIASQGVPVAEVSQALVLPQIGAGPTITTELVLIGADEQATTGTIRFAASDGRPLALEKDGISDSEFDFRIEAGGVSSALFVSRLETRVGYAVITVDEGRTLPAASAIFQLRSGGELVSEAGVAAAPATTRSRLFVDNVGTQIGVAVASPQNPPMTIVFELFDLAGGEVATTTRELPADGHLARFVDELFEGLAPDFKGTLQVSAPAPFFPITLKLTVNTRGDPILTSLPINPENENFLSGSGPAPSVEGPDFLIFPQIGIGSGLATDLLLVGNSGLSEGSIQFFGSGGFPLDVTFGGQLGQVFDFRIAPLGGLALESAPDLSGPRLPAGQIPEYNLQMEPALNPPTSPAMDAPHSGGIDILGSAKLPGVPGLAGCRPLPIPPLDTGGISGAGVYLHSGEFFVYSVDLEIPGRGFNWRFARKYRSGISYAGVLGHNWSFNYERRLVVVGSAASAGAALLPAAVQAAPGDLLRLDGTGRLDVYRFNQDGSYQSPPGFFTQLTRQENGGFRERDAHGNIVHYGAPDAGVARMSSLEDRNRNRMSFEHDGAGRLVRVIDTLGRPIDYLYGEDFLLAEIRDFVGRSIHLSYDEKGNLESVTTPAVVDTPTGNNFPEGRTTIYTYTSGSADRRLNHNLTSITAPNEVEEMREGASPDEVAPRVQVEYDSSDRVTGQTIGGTNSSLVPAGGRIAYQILEPDAGHPQAQSVRLVRDRNGNETIYSVNSAGQVIRMEELANRSLRSPDSTYGQVESYLTEQGFNADGQLIETRLPRGNGFECIYDESNPDRHQQGNLLRRSRLAYDDPTSPDQVTATTHDEWTYEPVYNQVRSYTDARGNDPDYQPPNDGPHSRERFTWMTTYDYQEGNRVAALAEAVGVSAARMNTLLRNSGIAMGLGDVNRDGVVSQVGGNQVRSEAPPVRLAEDSRMAEIEGSTVQPILRLFRFNSAGQLVSWLDPEGNRTSYFYYPENDPDGDGLDPTPGVGVAPRGYLRLIRRDDVQSAARNSGENPPVTQIRTLLHYDPVGNLIRRVDGRGIATDFTVNQANQIVEVRRSSLHNRFAPEPAEPDPLVDFGYRTQLYYDANGNVIRRRIEDRGNTSGVEEGPLILSAKRPGVFDGPAAWVDFLYGYDILDQLLSELREVSFGQFLATRFRYDPNGNRVLTIEPEGNASSWRYDERDLLYQTTRGAPNPPPLVLLGPEDPANSDPRGGQPATRTLHYDLNGNLAEEIDAEDTDGSAQNNGRGSDADRTRYTYDGFDRHTSTVDSVGNQSLYEYDPVDNPVRQTDLGPPGGPSPTSDGPDEVKNPIPTGGQIETELLHLELQGAPPLRSVEFRYDEVNRLYQVDDILFVETTPSLREADVRDGAEDLGKGNVTPEDDDPIPGLEGLAVIGRVTRITEYDRNSRPVFRIEDDGDVYRSFYDGADREIVTVDPAGNRLERVFDDNHNLIETRETDAVTRSEPFTPGNRIILSTYFYDSLNRLQRTVDNLGNTTEYRYDSRNNLVSEADASGPAGPAISRRFFPSGPRTVNTRNHFGNVTLYFYDGLSRLLQRQIIQTASGQGDGIAVGATIEGVKNNPPDPDPSQGGGDGRITETVEWDRNSLLRSLLDDNRNQTHYEYDNLNRLSSETKGQCLAPELVERCDPPTTTVYDYDRDSNLRRKTDENGSIIDYQYDAINRLIATTVDRGPGVVGTTVQGFEYDGLSRPTRATDNNDPDQVLDDSLVEYSYDSLSRPIEDRQQVGTRPMAAVSSAWRGDGLRSALQYPDEQTVEYRYDSLDRVRSVSDGGQSVPIAEYDYIGTRRVLERRYPQNGTRMTFLDDDGAIDTGYDGLRRPVQLRHLTEENSIIVGFAHNYDRMSNRLTQRKLHAERNSERYTYDSAYRLVRFERGQLDSSNTIVEPSPIAHLNLHRSWSLDGVGNWPEVVRGNGNLEQRDHSSFNELIRSDHNGFEQEWQHDENGNWTGREEGSQYLWDFRNRLSRIRSGGVDRTTYSYDALDRRIRKDSSNSFPVVGPPHGISHYYLDGAREIQEELAGMYRSWNSRFVYRGDSDELLIWDLEIESKPPSARSGRYFYHQDSLGSVYALTDIHGKVVEGYQYEAYGGPVAFSPESDGVVRFGGGEAVDPFSLTCANALCNPYQFTGRRYDHESGLFHFRNRYLNSEQGRFISRDPAGIWGDPGNLGGAYTYVGNSPVNRVDPMGTQGQSLFDELTPGQPWELNGGGPANRVLPPVSDSAPEWPMPEPEPLPWLPDSSPPIPEEPRGIPEFRLPREHMDDWFFDPLPIPLPVPPAVPDPTPSEGVARIDRKTHDTPANQDCPHCGPVCSPGALHRLWCESCLENRGAVQRFFHEYFWMPVACPHREIPPLGSGGTIRG